MQKKRRECPFSWKTRECGNKRRLCTRREHHMVDAKEGSAAGGKKKRAKDEGDDVSVLLRWVGSREIT